jgi:acyl transferase domain-containing protein
MPDARDAQTFWQNIKAGRYSVSEVHPERWQAELYYDPDPKAPDKTYTKIGGWVRDWHWDPLGWKLPIPPRVSDQMDLTQKWGLMATREALADYGYPDRAMDPERTAVIFGNAMGGDTHLFTASRILFPEYAVELSKSQSFADLPGDMRETIIKEMREGVGRRFPPITEDTMPGELSNVIAGRIAALYNFRGPNYVADAACASTMAALAAAVEGLEENEYDVVVTGGIDANMCAQTFVKFCKIGALSATGTRPYADGADGFVMGEGAAVFIIKRLEDAERDGDKIYAVIRALGGSSDGRGKGITAPNPIGQKLAVQRAWQGAGVAPSAGDMIEGHGTSTAVGDVVEVESLSAAFADYNLPPRTVTLGSVKSNIGHLKGAAAAAGLFKAAFSLRDKVLPPSINCDKPNPGIDFGVAAEREWGAPGGSERVRFWRDELSCRP